MSIAVKKALGLLLNLNYLFYLLLFAYVHMYLPIVGFYLSENLGLNIEPIFSFLNFTRIFLVGLLVLPFFLYQQ